MYKQVEKSNEKKNRVASNCVAQEKSKSKQGFGFVDSRINPASIEKKLHLMSESGAQQKNSVMVVQKIIQMKEPKDYAGFLGELVRAGYAGAGKAHVPHKGSEVKAHFYTDKIAEARAHAAAYPNAGVNLSEIDRIERKYNLQ